jgi:hypothetical protein
LAGLTAKTRPTANRRKWHRSHARTYKSDEMKHIKIEIEIRTNYAQALSTLAHPLSSLFGWYN